MMNTTAIELQLAPGISPLPGYRLEACLGVGGSGEVWSAVDAAEARKAIKFVFGHWDDERASHELKSLKRLEGIQHKSILHVESIAFAGDHLAIVTEIAESNLRSELDRRIGEGFEGLPREQLCIYLEDVAEALDFLAAGHSLQHLDVKPENLLLVAGQIKLADFGLLKHLSDVNVSMVYGLTPKYAAPELFDGKPNSRSDQYSLAVVYKELATGSPPFDGQTPATLTSQHLYGHPNLEGLTPSEQFAVGKALSKDAHLRFSSCREFVKRLTYRSSMLISGSAIPDKQVAERRNDRRANDRPAVQAEGGMRECARSLQRHDGRTIVVTRPQVVPQPFPEIDEKDLQYRPAIFVGIGETGGKTLCHLRQLLIDVFGSVSQCRALQFLYLDTDVTTVNRLAHDFAGSAVPEGDTLLTPLRNTWDYRERDLARVNSISRRWLYNIPKSLRTEGVRSLGRVALLDNAPRVLERIRRAIDLAVDDESLQATIQQTGLAFDKFDPRVFLVGSIAGGTGGGMMIDVAYAIRQLLAERGLSDQNLAGMLVYGTQGDDARRTLAPANALALLQELKYFTVPGNDYPGEAACRLSGFHGGWSAFGHTYLLDLGDGIREEEYDLALSSLAQYLFLSSTSAASKHLDACRANDARDASDETSASLRLRSLGVAAMDKRDATALAHAIDGLCYKTILGWRGKGEGRKTVATPALPHLLTKTDQAERESQWESELHARAEELLDAFHLHVTFLGKQLQSDLNSSVGQQFDKLMSQQVTHAIGLMVDTSGVNAFSISAGIRHLNLVVGIPNESTSVLDNAEDCLKHLLESLVVSSGESLGREVNQRIRKLMDVPDIRVSGAMQIGQMAREILKDRLTEAMSLAKQYAARRQETLKEIMALGSESGKWKRSTKQALTELVSAYSEYACQEILLISTGNLLSICRAELARCLDALRDYWRDLNQLAYRFIDCGAKSDRHPDPELERRSSEALHALFDGMSEEMLCQLITDVEDGIGEAGFQEIQRVSELLGRGGEARLELEKCFRTVARKVLFAQLERDSSRQLNLLAEACDHANLEMRASEVMSESTPKVGDAGGGNSYVLMVAPGNSLSEPLQQALGRLHGTRIAVVEGPVADTVICQELSAVDEERVMDRFVRTRPDCQELAPRLKSRVDINW